nr:potassium channel KOR1-like isoform X1 [Tanacetum cinerariifolium]
MKKEAVKRLEGNDVALRRSVQDASWSNFVARMGANGKDDIELPLLQPSDAFVFDIKLVCYVTSGFQSHSQEMDFHGRPPFICFAPELEYKHSLSPSPWRTLTDTLFAATRPNSPLPKAIKNGQDQVVSMLVEAGASLDMNNARNCLCGYIVFLMSRILNVVTFLQNHNQIVSDRFYRALYSKLLLPSALNTSNQTMVEKLQRDCWQERHLGAV